MLGVAGASPIVHPTTMEIVCTAGGGMKIVVTSDDGQSAGAGRHTLDCSLCLTAAPPPPQPRATPEIPQVPARALKPAAAAHIAALAGAPLPPRGPPIFA